MGKAAPAFQWYPDVFEQGTATMTLSEVGGYVRLLNHQWAHGHVPGDNLKALSRILRCTATTAKAVWTVVSQKFDRNELGEWRNRRLERERTKQAARRDALAQAGKLGSEAKAQAKANAAANAVAQATTELQQKDKPNGSLSSSSSSSEIPSVPRNTDPTTSTPSDVASSSPLIVSPKQFDKASKSFAFYGSRVRVPHVLHAELRDKLGGENPEQTLMDWYDALNIDAEITRETIADIFKWLRPKFVEWAEEKATTADLERFRPKGA